MADYILCYDFGGTALRVGVATRGRMIHSIREDISRVKTNESLDQYARVLGDDELKMAGIVLCRGPITRGELMGIGIGGAGTWKGLIITFAPNSPIKYDISFPTAVKEHFEKHTIGGNDIRAAVHGAAMYGHGKGRDLEVVCAITYSTGNNIGILNKGEPYPGYSDLSQEVGHAHIEHGPNARLCGCGARGCFEAYVSGTAAANMAKEYLDAMKSKLDALEKLEEAPTIYRIAKKDLEKEVGKKLTHGEIVWGVKAEHVYEALAKHNDPIARAICETQKYYIATQLAHVSLHHRPQLIVLFGGLTNQAELLFEPAIRDLKENPIKYAYPTFEPAEIKITRLGDEIGLYGAAGMVSLAEKTGRLE